MNLYEVHLDNFTGPLDLLLHLIKKNEMDIYDIPIAAITSQYLEILDAMQTLNLDVAGEFLLMAASLVHVKSRLLLPKVVDDESEEDEDDPRAELVRRLLEYQKYKEAAVALDEQPKLNQDVFSRFAPEPEVLEKCDGGFVEVSLFDLLAALQDVLRENPEPLFHTVDVEQLSVTDRINAIMSRLQGHQSLAFYDLFPDKVERSDIVVTFLAMLELVRLRMVRFMQNKRFGTIWLMTSVEVTPDELELGEEALGYS
ncbi:MAG: segregation/condensation protein A [Desulfuromonadales bacterium]|jgi:segregation and condensation protein A|nr:segregation/condensation protein A [Desulfuromonadales bacterium]